MLKISLLIVDSIIFQYPISWVVRMNIFTGA